MHRDRKTKSDKSVKKKIKPFSKPSDETKVEGKFPKIITILFSFSLSFFVISLIATPVGIIILPSIIILVSIQIIRFRARRIADFVSFLDDLEQETNDVRAEGEKKSIDDFLKQIMEQDNFGKS